MTAKPICNVVAFDLDGNETPVGELRVETGEGRVGMEHDFGAVYLTSEQSIALEDRLAQARADVDSAQDGPPTLRVAGLGWICEVCCSPVAQGSDVAVWSEPHRTVVAHAGRCPEPEMWVAEYWCHEGCRHERTPRPFEEAMEVARYLKQRRTVARVRLVRVRPTAERKEAARG